MASKTGISIYLQDLGGSFQLSEQRKRTIYGGWCPKPKYVKREGKFLLFHMEDANDILISQN